jgi:hypothetical protein
VLDRMLKGSQGGRSLAYDLKDRIVILRRRAGFGMCGL